MNRYIKRLCELIVLTVIVINFDKVIQVVLNKTIVKFWDIYLNTNFILEYFVILCAAVCIIRLIVKLYKGYVVNGSLARFVIYLALVYGYYSFYSDAYVFNHFDFCNNVFLLDIILVVGFYFLALQGYREYRLLLVTADEFNESRDIPLISGEFDTLNRKPQAQSLARDIHHIGYYNVGIVGAWGEGKTSFVNMVLDELKNLDNVVTVRFNPWQSKSPEQISKDYFRTLKICLKPFSGEVYPELNKYLDILLNTEKNVVTKLTRQLSSVITLEQQKEKFVNEALKRINKKIVVFIDDIDRLDSNEVIEVFKLIRNTADFTSVTYIGAYDRNYLINSISKINGYKPEEYLAKIFQSEYVLAQYDEFSRVIFFIESLMKRFKEGSDEYRLIEEKKGELIQNRSKWNWFIRLITNMRDVKRMVDSFSYAFPKVWADVDFYDLVNLYCIRTKHFSLYEILKSKKIVKVMSDGVHVFDSNLIEEKKIEIPGEVDKLLSVLLPKQETNSFSLFHNDESSSLSLAKNFERYFSPDYYKKMPRATFLKYKNYSNKKLKEEFAEWYIKGYLSKIYSYLQIETIDELRDVQEYKNYIQLWTLTIAKASGYNYKPYFDLLIYNECQSVANRFFVNNLIALKIFWEEQLKSIIDHNCLGTIYYSLIVGYDRDPDYRILFSKKELQRQILKKLKASIKEITCEEENTKEVFNKINALYYGCLDYINKTNDHVMFLGEANRVMKDYILTFPKQYLEHYIRPKVVPDDGISRDGDPFTEQIFGDPNMKYRDYFAYKKGAYDIICFLVRRSKNDFSLLEEFMRKYSTNKYQVIRFEKYPKQNFSNLT
ncbi:KAP family P-loop NTPase fold protein [Saccharicrinis fermentans]|uniref:Putative P-loop ATPase n=1 Tax=Saccharicrinis fermentans DSM 9555 = JCM 21142 TaxID=869213 RepID=W7YCX1_9BACT|nr:P-loop NTPase fold protein [Saccharicrinis fermentans]GAF05328.1 putative P-loop ATPase [Saccharicrinis fermentans DSM 9555 = JCM 21142]